MDTEQALISKKALLARYGISYGSLYRWKRMGLIPDEWFLRKATVTGQETFFPEALICERVERILATTSLRNGSMGRTKPSLPSAWKPPTAPAPSGCRSYGASP